jgi:hypothetical protein
MKRGEPNTNLASEFYVASQLFRLGYTVTITLGNAKEIDIIACKNGKIVTIDVKGLKNTTNWPLNPKRIKPDHFYVLVTYKNNFGDIETHPEVFVIPSGEIKRVLGSWSGRPDIKAVGYNKIRTSKYLNAWNLLKVRRTRLKNR